MKKYWRADSINMSNRLSEKGTKEFFNVIKRLNIQPHKIKSFFMVLTSFCTLPHFQNQPSKQSTNLFI